MVTNYDKIADAYIKSRDDIPEAFIDNLELRGIEISGAKIADLGAGPGYLSNMLSEKGAIIDAVEPTKAFVDFAKKEFKDNQRIQFKKGTAEKNGLSSQTYDIVIVMRAWHWFNRDEVIDEVKRILKPGGYLVIGDVGFTGASKAVKESMKIIRKSAHDYSISGMGSKGFTDQLINNFPVEWYDEWQLSRLDLIESFKREYKVKYKHEDWMGRLSSVSSLAKFKEKERKATLDKIEKNLIKNVDKNKYKVPHVMSVVVLENKNKS